MTAVSSSSVSTESNVGSIPPSAWPKVSTPSNGDSPSRAAVITKKCSQVRLLEPGIPLLPIQLGGALEAEVGLRVESARW